jgi:competence protein ComEA
MKAPGLAVLVALTLLLPGCGWRPWPFRHRVSAPPKPAVIDLNSASLRKVARLPGVTPSMAQRIVDGRPYSDPRDLVERGILTERELERIVDRVHVKGRD